MAVTLPFFVVVFLLCGIVRNVFGVTLSPCGSDNTAEVREGQTDTFTCTGLASGTQVDWTLTYNSQEYPGATCPAVPPGGSCTRGNLGAAFTASRVSNTESSVIIDPKVLTLKDYIRYGTLTCKDKSNSATCQTDYIVPVQGNCSIQPGTGSSQFQLDGKCTLQAGAKSSRNRFKCIWTRKGGTSGQHSVPLTANTYQTGCVLTSELPTDTGQYTYDVQLFPGRRTVTAAGIIQITKPEAPTVSGCGGGNYIPENTTVTCMCNTNGIGQPAGRLQWVKIGDSSVKKEGNYGDKSFTISQKLLRADHQSSQFRCNVQWAKDILGTDIKFNVGYPPTDVVLGINTVQADVTVDEHQSMDFRCQNSNGRPNPTLMLMKKNNNTALLNGTTLLKHMVVSRCEDSGEYTCTADNGMGPKFTGTPRSLVVRCSPRGTSDVGSVNFNNEPVSKTFHVTAYPVPTEVTFEYLGPSENSTGSKDVDKNQIELSGSCEDTVGVVYQSTCTVTVTNVTSNSAAGFYQVKVTNTQGSGQFRLQVLYKAPVPPDDGDKGGKEDETNIGGIVGGVIAVVVGIAVVIIVIIFVMKRRKDPAKEKFASSGPNAANGRHSTSHGELDNPAHKADPQLHSPADVEAPLAVEGAYAVVNKPKKPTGVAAASAGGAAVAGGSAEAVYTEVDKTKKKKNAAPAKPAGKAKKPRKEKAKKSGKDTEAHIYGNVETVAKGDKGKKGKKSPAMPMEEKGGDSGKSVNAEGLTYMEVDFTGVATSSEPPRRPSLTDQGVLYSDVDFAKTGHIQG